ncbi:MAG: T9SS type A sorting domain-containing protein [Bacteroidales bacterium]
MKKLLTLMAAMVIAPFSASSQQAEMEAGVEPIQFNDPQVKEYVYQDPVANYEANLENKFTVMREKLGQNDTIILTTVNPSFTITQNATLLSYDPYTNTTHMPFYRVYKKDEGEGDKPSNAHLRSVIFTGTKFQKGVLTSRQISKVKSNEKLLTLSYSSVVVNSEKSKDTSKLKYASCYYPFVWKIPPGSTKGAYYKADKMYMSLASSWKETDMEDFEYASPRDNNTDKAYDWRTPNMISLNTNAKDQSNFAGAGFICRLSPTSSQKQYGPFGYGTMDIEEADLTVSKAFRNWDDYFLAAPAIGSTFNSESKLDADDKGNLYICAVNFKKGADKDKDKRQFAVTKSTDMGKTWTSFELSGDLITQYVLDNGASQSVINNNAFENPFASVDFAVTGEDEFSIFTTIFVWKDKDKADIHIVEVFGKKENDTMKWGVRKVAQLNNSRANDEKRIQSGFVYEIVNVGEGSPTGHRDSIVANRTRPIELQVARVQDSKDLVVKWNDYRADGGHVAMPEDIPLNSKQTFDKGEKVYAIDVFAASKKAGATAWNEVVNLTNDPTRINNMTYIPRYIPSMEEVPMILGNKLLSFDKTYFNQSGSPTGHRAKYPKILFDLCRKEWKQITLGFFDFTPKGNVEGNPVQISNVEIKSIYPNPSSNGKLSVTLGMEAGTRVTMDVVDALGNKVLTLINNEAQASSVMTQEFEIQSLNTGVYYLSVTANGKTVAKPFSVVK